MLHDQNSCTKITAESFPFYLCYGTLDESSIRQIEGSFVADYKMQGQKVMEVKITEKYSEIKEYWEGKRLALTSYSTLKQAVLTHFSFINQKESPIHSAWINSITGLGNIYIDYIDLRHVKQLNYPGVFIHDIFIPLRQDDILSLNKILSNEIVNIFTHTVSESMITWKSRSTSSIIQEKITLVKIEAPTAFIYDILKNINNYFYEDKMWRTVVSLHSYTKSIGIKIFYGTENDLYCNYSILLNNESMQKKNKN